MGFHFMPAGNGVCAVALHGNRKLRCPLKEGLVLAHGADSQPRCGGPAGGWWRVSCPKEVFSVLFSCPL